MMGIELLVLLAALLIGGFALYMGLRERRSHRESVRFDIGERDRRDG